MFKMYKCLMSKSIQLLVVIFETVLFGRFITFALIKWSLEQCSFNTCQEQATAIVVSLLVATAVNLLKENMQLCNMCKAHLLAS